MITPDDSPSQLPPSDDFQTTVETVQRIYDRKATEIFCVMDRAGNNHVRERGLDRPYCTLIRKIAEQVALETNGVVVTLAELAAACMAAERKKHSKSRWTKR